MKAIKGKTTLVSVILPIQPESLLIDECIESIRLQDLENIEIILIDFHSPEGSLLNAKNLSGTDKRFKILKVNHFFFPKALNEAIELANSEFIAIQNPPDKSRVNRLSEQYTFLKEHPEVGVVSCSVSFEGDVEQQLHIFKFSHWSNRLRGHEEIFLNRFLETPLIHSSVMFRKSLIIKYGGYRSGDFNPDQELWLRWFENGVIANKLPKVLVDWLEPAVYANEYELPTGTQTFNEMKAAYLHEWLKVNNPYYPKVIVWGAGRRSRYMFWLLQELGSELIYYIDLMENLMKGVHDYKNTPPPGRHFILIVQVNPNSREKAKQFLLELGYKEGKDFLCYS